MYRDAGGPVVSVLAFNTEFESADVYDFSLKLWWIAP